MANKRFMLFDAFDSYVRDLTPLQAKRTRSIDQCGIDQLELVLLDDVKKYDRVLAWDAMGRLCEWVVVSARTVRSDSVPLTTAVLKGSMQDLSGKFLPALRLGQGAKASQALAKAIEGTRWTVGTCEGGDADYSFYHQSTLKSIEDICNAWSLEVRPEIVLSADKTRIAARRINLFEHIGRSDCGLRLDYGTGLTEIDRVVSSDDVVTRLYCYGKGVQITDEDGNTTGGYSRKITFAEINDGKEYVEDASLLKLYGIPGPDGTLQHREGIFEDGDCEDKAQLLAEGKAKLKELSAPIVSYEGSVEALGRAGFDGNGCDLGDNVQLVDTTFPTTLRLTGRVLEIDEDMLGDGSPDTVKLGNIVQPYSSSNAYIKQAVDRFTSSAGSWDDAAAMRGSYLDNLINGINTVLNAVGGYVYLVQGEGLYVYDKPKDKNPTQCIMLGGGYLRIADSKKSDGSWNFRTAATGHGFIADALVSGTIDANLIRTGLLTDKAGKNFWNLDTGAFQLSPGDVQYSEGWTLEGVVDDIDKRIGTSNDRIDTISNSAVAYTVRQYALSEDSGKAPVDQSEPDAGWSEQIPDCHAGAYIWERQKIVMVDGRVAYTDPVLSDGLNSMHKSSQDISSSLLELDTTVNDLAKDGVVTEAEQAAVKKILQTVSKEQSEMSSQYRSLLNNNTLNDDFKTSTLTPAYISAFGSDDAGGTYGELKDKINAVLKCKTSVQLDSAMIEYESAYSAYASAINAYIDASVKARHAIEQGDAESMAKGLLSDYDNTLTQKEIFDRLTDSGKTQGIYMQNGKLYINASYMSAGTISDIYGRSSWNLGTGTFKTNYMTATNITASGTFTCGSTTSGYGINLDSNGRMNGYSNGSRYSYIDCSATVRDLDNNNTLLRGLQMQANDIIRISSPRIGTANSSNISTTTNTAKSVVIDQPIVSKLTSDGNGNFNWMYGNFRLTFINGLLTGYSLCK